MEIVPALADHKTAVLLVSWTSAESCSWLPAVMLALSGVNEIRTLDCCWVALGLRDCIVVLQAVMPAPRVSNKVRATHWAAGP